jgi:hypothetical protein
MQARTLAGISLGLLLTLPAVAGSGPGPASAEPARLIPEGTNQQIAARVSPGFRDWVFNSDRTINSRDGFVAMNSWGAQPPPHLWPQLAQEVACRVFGGPGTVHLGQMLVVREAPHEPVGDYIAVVPEVPPDGVRLVHRRPVWFFEADVKECP